MLAFDEDVREPETPRPQRPVRRPRVLRPLQPGPRSSTQGSSRRPGSAPSLVEPTCDRGAPTGAASLLGKVRAAVSTLRIRAGSAAASASSPPPAPGRRYPRRAPVPAAWPAGHRYDRPHARGGRRRAREVHLVALPERRPSAHGVNVYAHDSGSCGTDHPCRVIYPCLRRVWMKPGSLRASG